MTAKVQEIDWSKSILDVQIARGNAEFQPGDQYLSNFQIEEILVNRNLKDSSEIYEKAIKTLEKLKSELLLPKISASTNKSEEGLEKILSQCVELFRARALVVKILKLIHQREDVMLRLIASEEEDIDSEYDNMENLGKEILQIIAFLKHCKFPIHSFIYLGEDYAFKIQKDNESIISLYPKLKSREAYIGFNL
jgi:MoaA/NifB/PqqE/SkfB family radical SAM enzyme